MQVTNNPAANVYVKRTYREGWTLQVQKAVGFCGARCRFWHSRCRTGTIQLRETLVEW